MKSEEASFSGLAGGNKIRARQEVIKNNNRENLD
jgi:hypothetical protein